ncbi:MAG: hypothetical protein ABSF03_29790, partial [Streptosporangiaceae bacterium]
TTVYVLSSPTAGGAGSAGAGTAPRGAGPGTAGTAPPGAGPGTGVPAGTPSAEGGFQPPK